MNSNKTLPKNVSTEVEVNLRPTVSRPVFLGVRRPSGTCDQFFFLLEISFRQLRVFYFVAPFLTRGRVCNLLQNCFWALPEQSLLGRSPAELTTIFYCLIWDSPNLWGQVPVFISPRNKSTKFDQNTFLRAVVKARGQSDKHRSQFHVSFVLQMSEDVGMSFPNHCVESREHWGARCERRPMNISASFRDNLRQCGTSENIYIFLDIKSIDKDMNDHKC
jgi:hypothetical protein